MQKYAVNYKLHRGGSYTMPRSNQGCSIATMMAKMNVKINLRKKDRKKETK